MAGSSDSNLKDFLAGPGAVDRAMSGMPDNLVRILNKGCVVELWYENRSITHLLTQSKPQTLFLFFV